MCVAGELGVSKRASMSPSSTPQTELYFKQLEEGRRGATERGRKKKDQRKAGALRLLPLEQLCETVNPSGIFQPAWQH